MQGLFCSIHINNVNINITYIYASIISLMSDHPSAAGDCLVIAANQSSRVCASSAVVPPSETAPPERQWARVATVGESTPAKRDRVQQAETPRRSTRARKTIFSPPVEVFQTITAEQLHIGHVWALFDDEQLPSWRDWQRISSRTTLTEETLPRSRRPFYFEWSASVTGLFRHQSVLLEHSSIQLNSTQLLHFQHRQSRS